MSWQQLNNIPFRKKDELELKKQVARFNRKLKRIQKKYESETNILLPDKLDINELKQNIQTRKELNNFYKKVNRFMKRGSEELLPPNEKGIKMTKFERNEYRIGIIKAKSNIRKTIKRFDEINVKTDNPSLNFSRYLFKQRETDRLKNISDSFGNVEKRDITSLKRLRQRIDDYSSQSKLHMKNQIYKQNYLNTLKETYQYHEGYEELYEKLNNIADDDFYLIIADDDIVSDIKQFYDKKDDDGYFNKVKYAWDNKMNLSNFIMEE